MSIKHLPNPFFLPLPHSLFDDRCCVTLVNPILGLNEKRERQTDIETGKMGRQSKVETGRDRQRDGQTDRNGERETYRNRFR